MAFTSTDLTSLETAMMALATGAKAVKATISGKTFEFTDLDKLRSFYAEVKEQVMAPYPRVYAKHARRS